MSIILLVAFVLFLEREKNFETKKTFEDEEGNETSSFFFLDEEKEKKVRGGSPNATHSRRRRRRTAMLTRPHARRTTTEEEEEEEFWRQRARVLRNLSCCCSSSGTSSSSSSRWNFGNGVLGVQKLLDRLDYCLTDSDDAFGFVQVNEREEEIENARKCFERTLRRHEMVREMEMDLLKRREFESRNTTSNNTATRLEEIFKTKKTSPILLVSKTKKEETTTTTPLSPEMSLSPDVTNDNDTENKRKVRRRTATHPDEKTTRSPLSNVINNRRREAGKPPRGNVKRSRATDDPLVTTLTTSTKEHDNAKEDSYVCPFESSTL